MLRIRVICSVYESFSSVGGEGVHRFSTTTWGMDKRMCLRGAATTVPRPFTASGQIMTQIHLISPNLREWKGYEAYSAADPPAFLLLMNQAAGQQLRRLAALTQCVQSQPVPARAYTAWYTSILMGMF